MVKLGTLKAFANFSPGFALKPWEQHIPIFADATLKGLRSTSSRSQLLQSCEESPKMFLHPGFQRKPWAGIGKRFQRYFFAVADLRFTIYESMCARGGAGIDQLVGPEIRKLFKCHQTSARPDLVIGLAVERPFIAAKKKTRQPAQPRQNSFTVRSCCSLATRHKALAIGRQINASFAKLSHATSYRIRCAVAEDSVQWAVGGGQ